MLWYLSGLPFSFLGNCNDQHISSLSLQHSQPRSWRSFYEQFTFSISDPLTFPPAIRSEFVLIFLWQKLRLLYLSTCPFCYPLVRSCYVPKSFWLDGPALYPCWRQPFSTGLPFAHLQGASLTQWFIRLWMVSPEMCNTMTPGSHQIDVSLPCSKETTNSGISITQGINSEPVRDCI